MEEERIGKRPRRKVGCIVIVLAVILLPVGAYVGFRLYCAGRVRAELAAIRKAGYPVTLEELNGSYPEPEGWNAADVYLQAFQEYTEPSEELSQGLPIVGDAELPARGEPLPQGMREAIVQHLEANKGALELLHEAAAMEDCRYPLDFTEGIDLLMPHFRELRRGARLLALEALHEAHEGRAEKAVESVAAGLALGRSLSREPALVSQLTRVPCNSTAVHSLERALSIMPLSVAQLDDLSSALTQSEVPDGMLRGLAAEAAFGRSVFEMLGSGDGSAVKIPDAVGVMLRVAGLLDLDQAAYLKITRQAIEACEKPLPERVEAVRALDMGKTVEDLPRYCLVTRTLLSAYDLVAEVDAEDVGRLGAARAALAVERYRLAKGRLPERLDELVPQYLERVPADPFDGEPLRYSRREKGYVVYSIGPDGKDDGGAEEDPEDPRARAPDVTFTIER